MLLLSFSSFLQRACREQRACHPFSHIRVDSSQSCRMAHSPGSASPSSNIPAVVRTHGAGVRMRAFSSVLFGLSHVCWVEGGDVGRMKAHRFHGKPGRALFQGCSEGNLQESRSSVEPPKQPAGVIRRESSTQGRIQRR